MSTEHELLAPAGNKKIAEAVLRAGADAVYVGGEKFGARAYAQNLSQEEILDVLDCAHLRGKKLFLTINTLLKNTEMASLYDYVLPFYEHGLDAVIVQDFGVLSFLRKNFPDLPLHASTQMSIASPYGAKFIMEHGASRIVPARELSIDEIKNIYNKTGAELECFIHGALCVSYSGQCMMSSFIGGRSGNRGKCAQPCRLRYGDKYLLSMKDLCTIEILPKLCQAGVYSFKIEGRMKSLEYAAGVTQIYRKYLDIYESGHPYFVEPSDMEALLSLGNRSGFTCGYYEMHGGPEMMAMENPSFESSTDEVLLPDDKKISVQASVMIKAGVPMSLTLTCGEAKVTANGIVPDAAKSRPTEVSDIAAHIGKLGGTCFYLGRLSVDLGDNLFIPVGAINALRRDAVSKLENTMLGKYRRAVRISKPDFQAERACASFSVSDDGNIDAKPYIHAIITDPSQLKAVLECENVRLVSLDAPEGNLSSMVREIHDAGRLAGYCFPYVFRRGLLPKDTPTDLDRFIARSYDSLGFAREIGIPTEYMILDDRLYIFSNEAKQAFADAGYSSATASFELNAGELSHMNNAASELMVYGYQPAMITAQCMRRNLGMPCQKELVAGSSSSPSSVLDNLKTVARKNSSSLLHITDRKGEKLPVRTVCGECYNVIYNTLPISLIGCADEINRLGFSSYRVSFLDETPDEIRAILSACSDAFINEVPASDIPDKKYTRGHFHRGVL